MARSVICRDLVGMDRYINMVMHKVGFRECAKIVYREYAAFSARTTIERYASTGVRKLQIGAGPNNLPGWLNTDIEPREGKSFSTL